MGAPSPLKRFANMFGRQSEPAPPLHLDRFDSKAEFDKFYANHGSAIHEAFLAECKLFSEQKDFTVKGHCYVCARTVDFHVDFALAREVSGKTIPAWRESVVCPRCQLSNRQRAAVHLVETEAGLQDGEPLYLTEQVSRLYKTMKQRHRPTDGSEYLGSTIDLGTMNPDGIRNEDLTHLTFPAAQFEAVMCFEVLEHVPNYLDAISELSRILKPGGKLVMTAPFNPHIQDHSVRARVRSDGSIEHLLEPEYHVDPLSPQGCLCYYHFGWAMLDDLRRAGFEDAYVVRYASRELGYLGPDPLMFMGTKSA